MLRFGYYRQVEIIDELVYKRPYMFNEYGEVCFDDMETDELFWDDYGDEPSECGDLCNECEIQYYYDYGHRYKCLLPVLEGSTTEEVIMPRVDYVAGELIRAASSYSREFANNRYNSTFFGKIVEFVLKLRKINYQYNITLRDIDNFVKELQELNQDIGILDDLHLNNFGIYKGQLVVFDYAGLVEE